MTAPVLEVSRISRRHFLTTTTAVGAGSVLAGCAPAAPAGSAGPRMRSVLTDRGPVEVPAAASRVACADFYGAFAVVDLDLVPVAVCGDGYEATGGPYPQRLRGVPKVGDFVEPDVEAVAVQSPDLILRTIDTPDEL
ncbi:twin-arginine translocation signal domain-containing protein [Pseudonocardia sp. TRM90224]|uniref:twin-arginine translocation signal domain-containing protein n=1 Tax=Pseudonocardia sp. TRM90224 TaxID=2812678 RepID=UPI001E62B5A9|nr:twin-arginine translocation signal domain-containing protein [Pseudonocardia sp. TRM90224]